MSTDSKMSFTNNLNLINPDDTEHPTTPVSNMPFDESLELRNSDYMSSEAMEISDEMEECRRLEREDIDAYDQAFQNQKVSEYAYLFYSQLFPPIPPSKEEENDDEEGIFHELEQKIYNGKYYADAMEMEAAMRKDASRLDQVLKILQEDKFNVYKDKIGDGKMKYIKDRETREMCTNAWAAITFSNNWDFVAQDIESFMWSNDPRISEITEKMEEFGYSGHSGSSFGYTMRNMQYLVHHGEEEFKKLFDKSNKETDRKFLDYCGGL